MKYYKSKCGYFYKIVGDKKIRISIQEYKSKMKGGTVKNNGILERSDFNKENIYCGLPVIYNTKITQYMLDRIILKVIEKPFFLGYEPVIFFGIDGKFFKYACYYEFENFSKKIIFKDMNIYTTTISKIDIKYLIELFWGLVNIRKKDKTFMNTLYNYLSEYFLINIQKLRLNILNQNIIRAMVPSLTVTKNRDGIRKSISMFNIKQSENIIKKFPINIQQQIHFYLKQIMKNINDMRKTGKNSKTIENYRLKVINQLAGLDFFNKLKYV